MQQTIEINKQKVQRVVRVAVEATHSQVRDLHPLEAIIGYAELLGRTIAAQEGTEIVHKELITIACKHVISTVQAAYVAGGKNGSGFNI